jgi:hypothetical protein
LNHSYTAPLMSTILSEFGEAYISLMRQGEEVRKYIPHSGGNAFEWKLVKLLVSVLRVGGGSNVWLLVYALMFVASAVGFIMALVKRHVLPWEAQGPVECCRSVSPNPALTKSHFCVSMDS